MAKSPISNYKSQIFLCVLCVSAVISSGNGCLARWIAGGEKPTTGVYDYDQHTGELERKYPAGLQECWLTTVKTIEKLLFSIEEPAIRDALSGQLNARRMDGTLIRISFEQVTKEVTSLKIKVGAYGERDLAMRIHEYIKENMPQPKKPK